MKKKIFYAALGAAMLMMGCSTKTTVEETVAVIETEETESTSKENSVSLEDVASLLNMQDNETAELFGGGEENWTEQITEQTGISPAEDSTVSEGGSQKKTWSKDGKQVTMHYMTDIMTISIQNMIGELK